MSGQRPPPNSLFGMGNRGPPSQGYRPVQGQQPPPDYRPPRDYRPPQDYQGTQNYRAAQNPQYTQPDQERSGSLSLTPVQIKNKQYQKDFILQDLCPVSAQQFNTRDGTILNVRLSAKGKTDSDFVVTARASNVVKPGEIGLSQPQRNWLDIALTQELAAQVYDPLVQTGDVYLGSITVEVGFASTSATPNGQASAEKLTQAFLRTFDKHVLAPGQRALMDFDGKELLVVVKSITYFDEAFSSGHSEKSTAKKEVLSHSRARGVVVPQTTVKFEVAENDKFKLDGASGPVNSLLSPDFSFENMGIGGLSKEFSTIFRRAFASRLLDADAAKSLGITHVKGMLLYGPPGTGKTLIARQIGNALQSHPPKVINGPEVLNKYVGQSEENIRKLFADAEKEYEKMGDMSKLHIIIFDELDAVCKQRGSGAGGGTGVGDSVVNQLLSKLDGVNQLNNILLIGMTNRKDMIDDALLRPGRLEVHVEISLPDQNGRIDILKIHTASQKKNGYLDADVDLEEIARLTKNFSGAELQGLVKAATSFALSRHAQLDQKDDGKQDNEEPRPAVQIDVKGMKVKREDFLDALKEVLPAYGVSEADLKRATRLGIIPYSQHVEANIQAMMRVVTMAREDRDKFSTSVLFHGPKGSGKTALAAHIAIKSGFPFIKMVRPVDLAGYKDDFAKKDFVHKAFADAWKSPASILILDDFERLIGWNPIGPRFSMTMLETLTSLIVAEPPQGHRLVVFATTSNLSALRLLEVDRDFANKAAVPAIATMKELEGLLEKPPFSGSVNVKAVMGLVAKRTGADGYVGLGIKSILDCMFVARTGGGDFTNVFADLVIEGIQSSRE